MTRRLFFPDFGHYGGQKIGVYALLTKNLFFNSFLPENTYKTP
jgi:hypothetical protein